MRGQRTALYVSLILLGACSGDSPSAGEGSALTDLDAAGTDTSVRPADDTADSADTTATADTSGSDTAPDPGDAAEVDTTAEDTTPLDTTAEDTTPVDTTVEDTTPLDTGVADTTPLDTGVADTTPADTGVADTTPADTGTDPDAPGPLPGDMGLPPLGFLPLAPIGASSTTCSTGSYWWGGDIGSDSMRPGGMCIDCHSGNGGPDYTFAGTVMGGYNDANECRGVPSVTIEILDASGNVALTMETNGAGNFSTENRGVEMPYSARVRYDGRVREMLTQTYNGDCDDCHSETGSEDAPGRIVLP